MLSTIINYFRKLVFQRKSITTALAWSGNVPNKYIGPWSEECLDVIKRFYEQGKSKEQCAVQLVMILFEIFVIPKMSYPERLRILEQIDSFVPKEFHDAFLARKLSNIDVTEFRIKWAIMCISVSYAKKELPEKDAAAFMIFLRSKLQP